MPFKYNLTAVGLRYDFPYVNLGHGCMTLDCPYPGAEVEFLRQSLRMANATATLVPREMNADEMIDMLGNGTADISIFALIQKKDRMEKVRFTTPIGFIYTGYFVREVAQIEVADYIMTSFRIPAFSILVLTSLTVAILLFFYTKLFESGQRSLSRWLMITFEALLKQFELDLDGPICVRILACAWLWFCFTMIVHFEAKLRSVLTLTRYRGTIFTNLDEAMDAMEYHRKRLNTIHTPIASSLEVRTLPVCPLLEVAIRKREQLHCNFHYTYGNAMVDRLTIEPFSHHWNRYFLAVYDEIHI
ncbi:hypothetical protein Y032_0124g1237 [Ancylostoma ceylanicum]|uniref:Solute-binding protein family 3/N-terminal domain-containing protein n=1 Tax=Ancylostoma ceylanicum TaxID=53326 RepID=A0A016T8E8_9BILA|nr:hypothetical protein Y032_0124g1237 [Ancylostoma ceylanicum]